MMSMRWVVAVGVFVSSSLLMGFASADGPETAEEMRRKRAQRQLQENERHLERGAIALDRATLPEMDPALIDQYQGMIEYLAAPEREGRVPGSQGIEDAAVYIEDWYTRLGLVPAFRETVVAADGTEVLTPNASFRQNLEMGVTTSAKVAEMRVAGRDLEHGKDFSVLAYSGSAEIDVPIAFTGYAVVSGPGGYMGFDNDTSLEGRIALCLNYEPMDETGTSLWRQEGWSHHSRLTHKVSSLARRKAAAVVIVSPPGAADERVDMLETIESTAPKGMQVGIGRSLKYDIPVVMVTAEVAEMMVGEIGTDRALDAMTETANKHGIVELLDAPPVSISVEMARVPVLTANVGAVLPGRGALEDEYIVVGAHYDHLGYAQFGARIRSNEGKLHPGADDNASGTAGMMIVAEMLKNKYAMLAPDEDARSVLFLAFTAEESGLNGSTHYTNHPIAPIDQHTLMLNMDMIGRLESDPLEVGGMKMTPGLQEFAEPFFEASGLVIARESSVGSGRSDHAPFNSKKVPAMFFFTGLHDDYHAPGDTPDRIDADGGVRIAVLCAQIGYESATTSERLLHRRAKPKVEERREPKVRIGILPSNAPNGGLRVQRVFSDTSASSAGLVEGDRIVKWDGKDIESVESWRPTLLDMSPGDVVRLDVERAGEMIEITMTLRAIE